MKLLYFCFLMSVCVSAQTENYQENSELSNNLSFMFFKADKSNDTMDLHDWIFAQLKHNEDIDFKIIKRESDQIGFEHIKLQQYYKGVLVENGVFIIHAKEGRIISGNCEYYDNIFIDVESKITPKESEIFAKKHLESVTKDWVDHGQGSVSFVVLPLKEVYQLCFKVPLYSVTPLVSTFLFIDAKDGSLVKSLNRICEIDSIGTCDTQFHGSKTITTDFNSTNFILKESGRGNGIRTLNAGGAFISNLTNNWTADKIANGVHFATEATYDYFFNTFGRNSYDNLGTMITSYVHNSYSNAFWTGVSANYGDGDGYTYQSFTSAKIVGHEITHGLTEFSAGLVYSSESGALNESFSDIFGIVVFNYANPSSTVNFTIGEYAKINGIPFRSLADPKAYNCPDTRYGQYWSNAVHTASGVQNHWFYLLCQGGSGTNDLGNVYTVSSIGMGAAAQIAFRNLTVYLTPNSTLAIARSYAIQAAIDLFGVCSPEVKATTDAWHAVGVGTAFDNSLPVLAFDHNNVTYNIIDFNNESLNCTGYLWDFGDGTTSTLPNPTHQYTSLGSFDVVLNHTGPNGICPGTLSKPNLIELLPSTDH